MKNNRDEKFYDLVYEAWRSGRDPDSIDKDIYNDYLRGGN